MNYSEANERLVGRCARGRKLENSTYLEKRDFDSTIAVRLHSTDIITFYKDGRIDVNTGDWNTVTTRDRLRRYLPGPWSVCSHRGACVLYRHGAAFEEGWLTKPRFGRTAKSVHRERSKIILRPCAGKTTNGGGCSRG